MPLNPSMDGSGAIFLPRSGEVRARQVVTRSGGIMRAKFPSRKNQRMLHAEGLLELDAFYLFEVSPLVVSYREQPCTVRYPDGARLRKYTPDVELTLRSGEQILVEIKPLAKTRQPEMAHKLACIAEHLQRNDLCYLVLTDDVIRQQPRLQNLRWIYQMAMRDHANPDLLSVGAKLLLESRPATIGEAAARLLPHGCTAYTYLLSGLLRLSLNQPISADTQIYFPEEDDHDWFQFADRFGI